MKTSLVVGSSLQNELYLHSPHNFSLEVRDVSAVLQAPVVGQSKWGGGGQDIDSLRHGREDPNGQPGAGAAGERGARRKVGEKEKKNL